MKKILFVCLGNICRSPLAQGIFEKKIRDLGLEDQYYADSAGTSGWHEGETPHSGSIRIAKANEVSIEKQRSRPVKTLDGKEFDYIVAMDGSNYHSLASEFSIPQDKLFIMRSFEPNADPLNIKDVPDPWGQGGHAFQNVFGILDRSIDGFIEFLRKKS